MSVGWEIGVFTEDNILAGAIIYLPNGLNELIAYGDDPDTDEVEGFQEDERMLFRIWDDISDEEFGCVLEWGEGPRT